MPPEKTIWTLGDGTAREGYVIHIADSREQFNEYILEDGAVLKLKSVASEVLRVSDAWDRDGNPVYFIKSQNVLAVSAPESLLKKAT